MHGRRLSLWPCEISLVVRTVHRAVRASLARSQEVRRHWLECYRYLGVGFAAEAALVCRLGVIVKARASAWPVCGDNRMGVSEIVQLLFWDIAKPTSAVGIERGRRMNAQAASRLRLHARADQKAASRDISWLT
jgi:hypothetical protein